MPRSEDFGTASNRSTQSADRPMIPDVRDHFDHDGPLIIIDAGRRTTAAWVRERWDGHHLGAEATVWAPRYAAIACTEEALERIEKEAPDHWIVSVSKKVPA